MLSVFSVHGSYNLDGEDELVPYKVSKAGWYEREWREDRRGYWSAQAPLKKFHLN